MVDGDLELKNRLKPFIDSLGSRLSVRASIINHYDLLTELRSEGYKVDDLIELTGCSYSRQTFSSAMHQAKKKRSRKKQPVNDTKAQPPTDIDQWISVFNFSQPLKKTAVLESTIQALLDAGWNLGNYHLLQSKKSITTMTKLIDVVSFIRSSKFKKNIFKDDQPCF